MDGTDFLCMPPNDGDCRRSWWSHKFKKPAVRYEVCVSIQSGDIVWVNGPWRAGRYPDISIFREGGLKDLLEASDERAEADLGYRGEPLRIDLPLEGTEDMILAKKEQGCTMKHAIRDLKIGSVWTPISGMGWHYTVIVCMQSLF